MNFMITRNSKSLTCTEQENQPLISIFMLCGLRLSLNFHSRRRRACKKWHGNVDGLIFSPSGIKDNFLFTRVVPKCINHTKIPPLPPLLSCGFERRQRKGPDVWNSFYRSKGADDISDAPLNQLFYNIFNPMENFFSRDFFADVMSVQNRNMKHARAI